LKKTFYGLSDNLVLNKTKNIINREQGVKKSDNMKTNNKANFMIELEKIVFASKREI